MDIKKLYNLGLCKKIYNTYAKMNWSKNKKNKQPKQYRANYYSVTQVL